MTRLERFARRRRSSAILVIASWIVAALAVGIALEHTDDLDPWQWPSSMFSVCAIGFACLLTFSHWVVLVPSLRERARQER